MATEMLNSDRIWRKSLAIIENSLIFAYTFRANANVESTNSGFYNM